MRVPKIGDLWKTPSYLVLMDFNNNFHKESNPFEAIPPNSLLLILDLTEHNQVKVYCNGKVGYFWKLRGCVFVSSGEDK